MQIESRIFGSIEIDDDKIITIPNGLMGFEQYTRYALAFDNEKQTKGGILWLQSVEEPALAFPMLDPSKQMLQYILVFLYILFSNSLPPVNILPYLFYNGLS